MTSRSGGRRGPASGGDSGKGPRRSRVSRSSTARGHLAGELDRGDQARRVGTTLARDVEGGAVIGRGAHEGQAECYVHAVVEIDGLERNQGLVVIHTKYCVIARACAGMKKRVGRERA